MKYQIGVDTGGTFTDCVVINEKGNVFQSKAFTTPENFTTGILQALEGAAEQIGIELKEMMGDTRRLIYGTTICSNALIQRKGAVTGVITTRGFEDTILIMRAIGRTDGLGEEEYLFQAKTNKPEPIVPRYLIEGVMERVDYKGEVLIPLNGDEVKNATRRLVDKGVSSIAVCFLWSFLNSSHEQMAKEILEENFPDLTVSISSEIAPVLGEYERTATTVLNSYLMPITLTHFFDLEKSLKEKGLKSPLLLMQISGGCMTVGEEVSYVG